MQQNILGICLGASTVSMVHLQVGTDAQCGSGGGPQIMSHWTHAHEGNPKKTLQMAWTGWTWQL